MKLTEEEWMQTARDLGIDVDKKYPPHWKPRYYTINAGFRVEDGYRCSRCGVISWVKAEICPACGTKMGGANK